MRQPLLPNGVPAVRRVPFSRPLRNTDSPPDESLRETPSGAGALASARPPWTTRRAGATSKFSVAVVAAGVNAALSKRSLLFMIGEYTSLTDRAVMPNAATPAARHTKPSRAIHGN